MIMICQQWRGPITFQIKSNRILCFSSTSKALGMAVMGIADAFSDCGFNVRAIDEYGRDKSGCFAGCVMNMDRFSGMV